MLRPIPEDAGLGVPPSTFTTNASESINAMLKRKVKYKRSELVAFIQHLRELIDEQQRDLERAVIKRGKYELRDEYKFLEVDEANWFKMPKVQREKHMKKVSTLHLKIWTWGLVTQDHVHFL